MSKVLSWDKPKRKMPKEEWMKISADSAPPGVYTPNMSKNDMLKWKAKHIKGDDERVEIRKSFYHHNDKPYPNHIGYSAQALIVVRRAPNNGQPQVLISTNGKMGMTFLEACNFKDAVNEAMEVLEGK
jgi:hypothetical protein